MKILKITVIALAIGFVSLFGYANLRILSAGEKEKMVELTAFKLRGDFNPEKISALEKTIQQTSGVRACTINVKSQTACVIYYKEVVSETTLTQMLTGTAIQVAEKKDLAAAAKGGCPVHKAAASFTQLLTSLDLRTH